MQAVCLGGGLGATLFTSSCSYALATFDSACWQQGLSRPCWTASSRSLKRHPRLRVHPTALCCVPVAVPLLRTPC